MRNGGNPCFPVPSSRLPFPCKAIKIRVRERMNVLCYCEIYPGLLASISRKDRLCEIALFFLILVSLARGWLRRSNVAIWTGGR